jgi:hypothetical protein
MPELLRGAPPGRTARGEGHQKSVQESRDGLRSRLLPTAVHTLIQANEGVRPWPRAQSPMSMPTGSHLHGKRTPGSVFQDGQPIHPRAGVLRRSHELKGVENRLQLGTRGPAIHSLREGRRRGGSPPSRILQWITQCESSPSFTLGASPQDCSCKLSPGRASNHLTGEEFQPCPVCRDQNRRLVLFWHPNHGHSTLALT